MTDEPDVADADGGDDGSSGDEGNQQDEERTRSVLARSVGNAALRSESVLLRTYAIVAALVGAFVALLVVLAFPRWVKLTRESGVLDRVARAIVVLVGLAVVAGIFAPLLFVERRRRAGRPLRERAHALAGYGHLCSLFLALVASAPPGLRSQPSGPLAPVVGPVVSALYALPSVAGIAFLALAVGLVLGVEYGLGRAAAE